MGKRNRQKLSDANLEIMKVAWQKREVTINEILEAINSTRKKKLTRATIQVQMRRLENYGWLKHRINGREFIFFPIKGEDEAKTNILRSVRDRLFSGSYAELVKCLFFDFPIPDEEIKRIMEFLKESEMS